MKKAQKCRFYKPMGKHKTFMTFENKSFTSYLAYFRQMRVS